MKKTFNMNDVRSIFWQLKDEEISMSKALEMLNEKADNAEKAAFERGWTLRMSRKGSQLNSAWSEWRAGSSENVG